jgi:hypothetical protein
MMKGSRLDFCETVEEKSVCALQGCERAKA